MSTPLEFSDALKGAFATYWAGQTPVAYPGLPFDPPEDGSAWVRLFVAGAPQGQRPIGTSVNPGGSFLRQGVVGVEIFVRQGRSLDEAYALADVALGFLENPRAIPNTRFFNLSPPVEVGPDGTYEQVNVSASFEYGVNRI